MHHIPASFSDAVSYFFWVLVDPLTRHLVESFILWFPWFVTVSETDVHRSMTFSVTNLFPGSSLYTSQFQYNPPSEPYPFTQYTNTPTNILTYFIDTLPRDL